MAGADKICNSTARDWQSGGSRLSPPCLLAAAGCIPQSRDHPALAVKTSFRDIGVIIPVLRDTFLLSLTLIVYTYLPEVIRADLWHRRLISPMAVVADLG